MSGGDIMDDMEQSDNKFKFTEVMFIVFITSIFSVFAGISYGKIKYSNSVNINNFSNDEKSTELENFIKQYKYIIANYYDSDKIDEKELLKIALESILNELGISDEYSKYMEQDEYDQLNINLDGEYEGIGISVYKDDESGYFVISDILENSPASKSDVKKEDYVISIDGKLTKDMETSEFSKYVIDSKDKNFVLKLKRGDDEFNINLTKEKIDLKSVDSKIIERGDLKIGYISMSIFASNTYEQFKKNLSSLEEQNIDCLIIDLRDNTGGHLSQVTKIISLFVEKKKVIYQLQKDDKKVKYYSTGLSDKDYPIVFLGNELTASASEVFIMSLKENLGAKLIGTKTYGKGTVQELVELTNGDQYKLTTKKWLSPNGVWINDTKGIKPDVEVRMEDEYYINPSEKTDNQLESAIKYCESLKKK